ncbi:hypothetical protein IC757_09855 [Wenzhouxiangella sp. AB-CW3]|uniref:hypothetical protein n=1 Tax=Wenzhouxiangella sp. AB-CW3 TaxID=2771012 RepID=UPI00168C006F|nr:hypothetical protein [Wenzhouxiangella sp. AB-CW3]QOC21359.1 hypothetical protein IC757_09855 [Wenzhouxiangella sp. AB-CW3]
MRTGRYALLLCLLWLGAAQASDEGARFLVEFELWLHGEVQGEPSMIVEAGQPAMVEVGGSDSGWRIEVEVERPAAYESAPDHAVWLHLAVHEQIDGEWEVLADTMLGVPEGQSGLLMVAEEGAAEPIPETSTVFLRATTSRLQSGDMPSD